MRLFILLLLAFLPACATFPALEKAIDPTATQAAFPDLVPFETIVTPDDGTTTSDAADELTYRATSLQNRAEQLRNSAVQ
jgi:hypothetical protein